MRNKLYEQKFNENNTSDTVLVNFNCIILASFSNSLYMEMTDRVLIVLFYYF